jgi:hypothetical protein
MSWLNEALKNGISRTNYYRRIKEKGMSPEEAATTPVREPRKDRYWIKLAEKNGISRGTYITRVDRNFWTPEEAASTPVMSSEETTKRAREQNAEFIKITHDRINKNPNNLFKITSKHIEEAKRNGIKKGTVRKRVFSYGWTVQEAITLPVTRKPRTKPKEFEKYRELAIQNNINPDTFRSRVMLQGWDMKKAATKPIVKSVKGYRWGKHADWLEKALKNGIKERTFKARISKGWTPEEASTIPTLKPGEFRNEETKEKANEGYKRYRNNKR